MALTKAKIAGVIRDECSLSKSKPKEIIEKLLSTIKDTLATKRHDQQL